MSSGSNIAGKSGTPRERVPAATPPDKEALACLESLIRRSYGITIDETGGRRQARESLQSFRSFQFAVRLSDALAECLESKLGERE